MTMRQQIIVGLGILVAFGCLALAIAFSGDTSVAGPTFSGSPVDGGGDRGADPDAEPVELDIDPIERWFPQAGEGSGCSEEVGVDLIPGYGAVLTINGVTIPELETNATVDTDGDGVGDSVTAGGSQGFVTWGPEPDCPFGEILRPTGNQVVACVYRLDEGPANCRVRIRPDTFDF